MSGKNFLALMRKSGNGFRYVSPKDEKKYEKFFNKLKEDDLIEMYMEIQNDDATLAQLARAHAMIREIAHHTGNTFEEMKLIVKRKAGLCIEKVIDGDKFLYCKSFGDCNKEELSLAIEAIREIAVSVDYLIQ